MQVQTLTPNLFLLQLTIEHVSTLALGAYFLDQPAWAKHARDKVATWFLDGDKGMLPNLRFAALVPGQTTSGRPEGINDFSALPDLLNGIGLIAQVCAQPMTGMLCCAPADWDICTPQMLHRFDTVHCAQRACEQVKAHFNQMLS